MYFTREEQIAPPEPIQASRNGSVQKSATEEATNDLGSPLISSVLSGDASRNAGTQILRSAVLSSRLSKGVRAVALSRAQQTHGNRFTQQLVSQIQLSSNGNHVVQRECGCGTCAKCSAPIESSTALDAPPESRRFLQAKSNGHSARSASNGHFIQAQTNNEDAAPAVDVREFIPQDLGHPLDESTRTDLEGRFGADFRGVRVHTDDRAAASAVALGANAFTTGRDIYFGAGRYSPSTQEGKRLLAHELTHVVQQSAGQQPSRTESAGNGEITVGAADDHLEQEADAHAEAVVHGPSAPQEQSATITTTPETSSEVSSETSNTVQRSEWTWGDNPIVNNVVAGASAGADMVASGVKTGVNAVGTGLKKGAQWAIAQIEKLAPGAIEFFRNIKDYFKNAINKGLDSLFGGVLSSIRDKGLGATLAEMVGGFASGALRAVGGFIAGYCGAIGQLAEFLLQLQLAYASGVFELVKKGFEAVRDKLDQLWTEYGAPALEFVTKKLKAIWKDVKETASKIWEALKPLREAVAEVWNAVTDFLAEGKRTYDSWMEGFVNAALDEWEKIKAKIKPYMGYVKTAAKVIGAVVVLFSPAGPFVVAGVAIYGLYVGVKALWDRWGKGFTKSAREWWANEAIPAVQNKLKEFRAKVDAVKQKVSGVLTQLYDAFMQVLGALGVLTFLATVKSIFDSITQKIREFKEKLDKKLDEWSKKIKDLVSKADPYLQQIKEAFRQTLLVSMLGPLAIMDDGVWNTIKRVVAFVMKTPCLREIGGLFRVPAVMAKIDGFRTNLKAMWKVIQNPDPLLEEIRNAIQPMVAKVEPEVRERVFNRSQGGAPAPQAGGAAAVGTAPAAATASAAAPAAAQAAPQLTPEQEQALKAAAEDQERKQLAAQVAQGGMMSEREAYISLSIWHYLSDSLRELAANWWEQIKQIGGDLIWPWPTVQKDWDPMVDHFGKAIDQVFELEFSDAIDEFLKGMKLFNSIAGALSGWFLIASVLIGAALGALGFVTGPGGVATVGAGAAAGLQFAETVGIGLLVIALATEAAVLDKASFDLKYQNLRIADEEERTLADQQDCKDIAGAIMSLVTLGALALIVQIASKVAKWVYSLVENKPLIKNVTTILKDFKKSVGDFSLADQPGGKRRAGGADLGPEGGPRPRDVTPEPAKAGEPAKTGEPRKPGEPEPAKAAEPETKVSDEAAANAEKKGVPREQFEVEVRELNQKASNPDNIRDPADPRFDAEMDAQGHLYDREKGNRTWCRFSDPACGLDGGGDLNAKVDAAKEAKAREAEALAEPTPKEALEPVETKPTEPAPPAEPVAGPEAVQKKSARDSAIAETKKKIDELKQKQAENQAGLDRVNKEIADATRKVEQLKEKVRNSSGEARKKAVEELKAAQSELRDAEGGGLLDERQGYLEEKQQLKERERNLTEALKLERPALRESTKRAIEAKADRAPDGRFLDANTGEPIDGVFHYGHKPGFEHRRLALEAQKRGMNQSQFNDWVNNNPDFFHIESEANNLSHKYEKPGID